MLAFRQEVARWYAKRYGVELNPEGEVLGLIGSKEGCHHFILGIVNPGRCGPDDRPRIPGLPGEHLHGAVPNLTPCPCWPRTTISRISTRFLPEIRRRAKAMFLNYPNNPTGACATRAFFSKAVEFAKAHDIAICHDNPYSEMVFDGQERLSFLSVPGAKDVGIELNSLSKPYNMTGWRIGMAMGNKEILAALCKVKENTDSGIFNAIQYAAIVALREEDGNIRKDAGNLPPPPETGPGNF